MKLSKAYGRQVFLNCPFDAGYRPIYEAVIFAVLSCGFVARCAREREDSGEPRISSLKTLVRRSCRRRREVDSGLSQILERSGF